MVNIPALIIGLIVVVLVVWRFKQTNLENTRKAYPLLLASFPFYYFVFAIYGGDFSALLNEFLSGLIFFLLAALAYRNSRAISFLFLGIGCSAHGIYDVYHDYWFTNAGMPLWWAEFCGSIDLILGFYFFYLALYKTRTTAIN